ncbi:MAG: hypothetical protein Q4C75_02800 [Bergeyella zoohelcum]|nr:hypothetical protein [Bergeyella zoohelcum]
MKQRQQKAFINREIRLEQLKKDYKKFIQRLAGRRPEAINKT